MKAILMTAAVLCLIALALYGALYVALGPIKGG